MWIDDFLKWNKKAHTDTAIRPIWDRQKLDYCTHKTHIRFMSNSSNEQRIDKRRTKEKWNETSTEKNRRRRTKMKRNDSVPHTKWKLAKGKRKKKTFDGREKKDGKEKQRKIGLTKSETKKQIPFRSVRYGLIMYPFAAIDCVGSCPPALAHSFVCLTCAIRIFIECNIYGADGDRNYETSILWLDDVDATVAAAAVLELRSAESIEMYQTITEWLSQSVVCVCVSQFDHNHSFWYIKGRQRCVCWQQQQREFPTLLSLISFFFSAGQMN